MANLTTESISESTKKILCDKKLYKDINFFAVPHNKVLLAVIRSITKKSFAQIGKDYKKSWFSIYFMGLIIKQIKQIKQVFQIQKK